MRKCKITITNTHVSVKRDYFGVDREGFQKNVLSEELFENFGNISLHLGFQVLRHIRLYRRSSDEWGEQFNKWIWNYKEIEC